MGLGKVERIRVGFCCGFFGGGVVSANHGVFCSGAVGIQGGGLLRFLVWCVCVWE